jgi:uncharacterized protein
MNESTPPDPTVPSRDERLWGMLTHLMAFAGYVLPFGHLVVPLVIWLIKKEEMPFVDDQGKESVNFQITMTLAALISAALTIVLIGLPLLIAVIVLDIVFVIIAAVKANDGIAYRYPICIRFIK